MHRLLALILLLPSLALASAIIAWTAPTTNTDNTPATETLNYNLYQGLQGATLVKVQTGIAGLTATVTAGLTPGTTQCFAVTAVNTTTGAESAQSAQACGAIPLPSPGMPTQITVIIH